MPNTSDTNPPAASPQPEHLGPDREPVLESRSSAALLNLIRAHRPVVAAIVDALADTLESESLAADASAGVRHAYTLAAILSDVLGLAPAIPAPPAGEFQPPRVVGDLP